MSSLRSFGFSHLTPRNGGVPRLALAMYVTLGSTGCGPSGPQSSEGPDFYQVDSMGVLISISSGQVAYGPLAWEVESTPDLVLGHGDSRSDYFNQIQGIRGLNDGGVLVVDGGSRQLRFYDTTGRLMKHTGGLGEGPGEFQNPFLVPVAGTDSLLVFDIGRPTQVLSVEGQFGRMIHHAFGPPFGGRAPLGSLGFHEMLFNTSGTAGGPEDARPDQGMLQLKQTFMWYDSRSGSRITIDSVLVDSRYYDRQLDWVAPFVPRSSAAVSPVGAFVTRGWPAEILEYDTGGQVRRSFRIDHSGQPVTRAMIDEFIDMELARRPARYASESRSSWYRTYEDMKVSDTLPAFQSLLVDEIGWLWAEVYDFASDRTRVWVVFDPEGRAHGTVRTPPGLEVRWIGAESILGVWRDEFGVEYVHRIRISRSLIQ